MTAKSLSDADPTTQRLVKKAEAAFKVMPDTIPMFDHFTPSAWLIRNPSALDGGKREIEVTLDRAEALFTELNTLLPKR